MNNIDTIYRLWVTFFYGTEDNYLSWLSDVKSKSENYNMPKWIMELVNALPYIATLFSFVFVIYLFYLLILFFKGLINVVENPYDDDDFKRDSSTTDKVKTYYYFKKKPGRKKRRF